MNNLGRELQHSVDEAASPLLNISDVHRQTIGLGGQWSARQILGHLIDIRDFIGHLNDHLAQILALVEQA